MEDPAIQKARTKEYRDSVYNKTVLGYFTVGAILGAAVLNYAAVRFRWWSSDGFGGLLATNIGLGILIPICLGNWRAMAHQLRGYCPNCGKQR